uniref:RING-type E3 ubiquitin transferase n=1 Tax=Globisporangium ultimum (strain ATCC 200006 / CBS 805.95 / DAOM BR144) TaxID=431595 RepID=K3WTU5_GLOUD
MSSWVSSWLQGRNDGDEEMKGDEAAATPAVVPSADEIRRKRLERLQKLQEDQQQQQQQQQAEEKASTPPASAPASSAPPATTTVQDTTVVAPTPSPASTAPAPPAAEAPPKLVKKRSVGNPRSYVNDMIQRILQLTLSSSVAAVDASYLYMTDVVDQSGATELNSTNVSEILYARIVMDPVQLSGSSQPLAVVAYLEQCFYRCREELHKLQSPYVRLTPEEKQDAEQCVVNIREMCINYSATALTEPDFFPFEAGTINVDAFDKLVRAQGNALTPEYVEAITAELEQSGSTFSIFGPIFQKLISELFLINPPSLMSDFYRNMYVITVLCRTKALAAVFTTISGFLLTPPFTGRRLQDATALGILLRFSPDQDPAVTQMFTNITKRTKTDVDNSVQTLQNKLSTVHNAATEILKLLLKAGGATREHVLTWLEQAMHVNAERAKENPDMNITSSNGMILNLTMVLLRLCGPFLPPESKKSHLINADFLGVQSQVFPFDATKLLSNTSDADDRRVTTVSTEFNFITRCYFTTARAIHLGPVAAIGQYMRLLRQLQYFQSRMNNNADPRLRAHFDTLVTSKMVLDAELLHPDLLHELMRFVLLSSAVVTSICCGKSDGQLELPLPNPVQNALLKYVPEHIVDDVCTVLVFISRLQPKVLQTFALDDLLKMILVVLSSPAYVRSPHLRAKMSEVLFRVFLPSEESDERQTAGTPFGIQLLTSNPLAHQHLAPCLLALYGDVEHTGFYEKLEHRYNIACLLKYLWKQPGHKAAFLRIAEDKEGFVKFAHGLMNHINGLVTDALISLPEIKLLQEEMQDVARWMALEESVREQKQSLLADKERTVTSSLQLANETIHMMSYLTSEIQEPFVKMPELEERLVSMLNSVLVKLAGPRGLELKVNNPEQYKFRPKEMLKEIVETLLHFAHYESFQQAVATNGYYDAQVFSKCATILERTQLLPPDSIALYTVFVSQVAEAAQSVSNLEETLGEIPEEYLDPLVFTLMKDPVTLPTSGYTMDRSTITQHLLNDQSDPFTRAPLTVDQLTPNVALKTQIEQWIHQQQQAHKAATSP